MAGTRERWFVAVLAGVFVSGIADDMLAGLVSNRSIWAMIPVYVRGEGDRPRR